MRRLQRTRACTPAGRAMSTPFRLCRIDHVVLHGIGLLQLRAGASLIDLVDVDGKLGRAGGAAPGAQGRNMDHLCLRVEPFDRDAVVAHLQAHGVRLSDFGQRYGAEGEGPSQYLFDPEGNMVELKGPPDQHA